MQKAPARSPLLIILIGLAALAAGVGGGVWLLGRTPARAPEAEAPPSEPAAPPSAAATAGENVPAAPVPEPTTASEPSPSAAPAASTAAPPAETTPPAPAASEMVPPPNFSLEAIPGDRAALLVKSSAQARVLVHGKDYGETNTYLLTTCGIRFVRLARGFNDFLEPGRSIVLKCGKLTEVTIDPK